MSGRLDADRVRRPLGDIYREARKSGAYFLRMPRDDSWNTHVVINGDSVIINDVE
jgi:hypothetical protein